MLLFLFSSSWCVGCAHAVGDGEAKPAAAGGTSVSSTDAENHLVMETKLTIIEILKVHLSVFLSVFASCVVIWLL